MSSSRQNDPFAVSTPQPHPGAANLSPQERKIYEFLWNHRDRSPSLGQMLVQKVPGWIVLAVALTLPMIVLYALPAVFGSGASEELDLRAYFLTAVGGILIGVMLRDYGYSKNIRQLWPIEAAVIDFGKVERLLWGESPHALNREEPLAAIPVDANEDAGR
ncbi:MAG TPA: hypothetical protein VGN57_10210 [Pirellulaceae bacterium]|jgi:hypothetical protein|nr:hypothetical protein [Pirellulaceae bacterium]